MTTTPSEENCLPQVWSDDAVQKHFVNLSSLWDTTEIRSEIHSLSSRAGAIVYQHLYPGNLLLISWLWQQRAKTPEGSQLKMHAYRCTYTALISTLSLNTHSVVPTLTWLTQRDMHAHTDWKETEKSLNSLAFSIRLSEPKPPAGGFCSLCFANPYEVLM